MKALISILIVLGVIFFAYKGYDYWNKVTEQQAKQEQATAKAVNLDPRSLPGLAPDLEASLQNAHDGGARSLKAWLKAHKDSPKVQDPRLAWIELQYVLLVAGEDPVEAKKVYAAVKTRVPTDSPIYPKIKEMEKTFGDN